MSEQSLALMPISDVKEIATQAVKSGVFALPNEAAAFTLMMICQSEGLHPMQAMKRYHIIKGRATMRADAMMAEFQAKGGKVEWIERTNQKVVAKFSHPTGGTVEVEWTLQMAKDAGLYGRSDVWKSFPRQMLTARVISEGIRTVLPGIVVGMYTPEEVKSGFDPEAADAASPTGGIAAALKAKAEESAPVDAGAAEIEDAQVVGSTPSPQAQPPAENNSPPSQDAPPADPPQPPTPPESDGSAPAADQAPDAETGTAFDRKAAIDQIISARAEKNINTARFTALCSGTIGRPERNADKWSDDEVQKILAAVKGV